MDGDRNRIWFWYRKKMGPVELGPTSGNLNRGERERHTDWGEEFMAALDTSCGHIAFPCAYCQAPMRAPLLRCTRCRALAWICKHCKAWQRFNFHRHDCRSKLAPVEPWCQHNW